MITADVHNRPTIYDELAGAVDRLDSLGIKATFLVSADVSLRRDVQGLLQRMRAEGHQIGCHGMVHDHEDYSTDSFTTQYDNLRRAKDTLENQIGAPVMVFRAPAFRIADFTLRILSELGFVVDLSICSQRVSLLSSQPGNYHWLLSPRRPYHPDPTNPYTEGASKLIEIPTSAALLPLMSALNEVSVAATEFITIGLSYEATIRGVPIVYQCHPEDFVRASSSPLPFKFSWRSVLPTAGYGIPLRWAFMNTDPGVNYERNRQYVSFLKDRGSFQFQTVDGFLKHYELSR
jgi:hypothetical protein